MRGLAVASRALSMLVTASFLVFLSLSGVGTLKAIQSSGTHRDVKNTPRARMTVPAFGSATQTRVSDSYGKLPLYFEANLGQTDRRVKFLSRGAHHTFFLTAREAVGVLSSSERAAKTRPEQEKSTEAALRMEFLGANPHAHVTGREELPGKTNYFIGKNPTNWRTNVATYAKVHYEHIYPGIDAVFYGTQQQLEYDFIVRPGIDARLIALAFQGADKVEVNAHGDLVLHTAAGTIRQRKPIIYQEIDGIRREVAGGYALRTEREVGFQVGAYDATRPLIIDPVLFYSTYLGGGDNDYGLGIAVDSVGSAYVTGVTLSTDFPTTVAQTRLGLCDAFVVKLNPLGNALVYSTYLGGTSRGTSNCDQGVGIAVDTSGNAYVTGGAFSFNFPTTAGAFQTTFSGVSDAFVTKLSPLGNALVYSTYLGGSNGDAGVRIAVDAVGNAWVTGTTDSPNFPTTVGAVQTTYGGAVDAFVTKLNALGSALVYSTYLGGSGIEEGRGIAVDTVGNAHVTGRTRSTDFPTTAGAFQTTFSGTEDAFVTKLTPSGSALVYSTYLGGSGDDVGFGIAVDIVGNAYVAGFTDTDFPTTEGALQTAPGGGFDAFVTKLNPLGSALVYSTYLGGNGGSNEFGFIAVDTGGNAYVTGAADSTNFPTTAGAFQTTFGGFIDAFVAKFSSNFPPTIQCMDPVTVQASSVSGATVAVTAQVADADGDGLTATFFDSGVSIETVEVLAGKPNPTTASASFTSLFAVGAHEISVTVSDGRGGSASCTTRLTVLPFTIAFAALKAEIEVKSASRFEVEGRFMLGAQSTGIDPVNQPVTLRVAEFSLTIPRNSFKRTLSGAFAFEGIVDGRRIEASIVPSLVSRTFGFEFEVATTDPTGGQIVVPVMLSIGHDSGTANGRVERKE